MPPKPTLLVVIVEGEEVILDVDVFIFLSFLAKLIKAEKLHILRTGPILSEGNYREPALLLQGLARFETLLPHQHLASDDSHLSR